MRTCFECVLSVSKLFSRDGKGKEGEAAITGVTGYEERRRDTNCEKRRRSVFELHDSRSVIIEVVDA